MVGFSYPEKIKDLSYIFSLVAKSDIVYAVNSLAERSERNCVSSYILTYGQSYIIFTLTFTVVKISLCKAKYHAEGNITCR